MKPKVLIIGGGIAGPALALFLNKAGIASTIYEAYPQMGDIGGGLQIAPNGMHVLEQIGMAGQITSKGVESDEFSFENQQGEVLGLVANGPAKKYGIPAVQIERAVLHRVLLAEVERHGIVVSYQKRLRHLTCDNSGVAAEFDDGTAAEGSLLIGADGIHSRTRDLIFPEGPRPVYTGLFTVGGFASHPSLVPSSRQAMCRAHMIFGRDGFFGYGYFDKQNPSSVMWWSHITKGGGPDRQDYKSWPTDELRKELLLRHQGWEEPVATILRNASELLRGPIYDLPSLPHWSKDRVVLIGDAAHAISPHAGQGASLALEDAITLAKLLRNSQTSHARAFEQYTKVRRNRVERIIAAARKRGDGKRILSPTAAWIRDRVISIFVRVRGDRMNDWMYSYKNPWEG
jgi:2-polyprenyl-6-methoxyphenol hydroxylase-like FAD-dependent oxidoreductase